MACGESAEHRESSELITTLSDLNAWLTGHAYRHVQQDPGCSCGWVDDVWASMNFAEHAEIAVIEDLAEVLPSDEYSGIGRLSWSELCASLRDDIAEERRRLVSESQRRAARLMPYYHLVTGFLREFRLALGDSRVEYLMVMLRDGRWTGLAKVLCEILISEKIPVSRGQYGGLCELLYALDLHAGAEGLADLEKGLNLVD